MSQLPESSSIFPETADIETASTGYAARFAGEIGQYFLNVQREIIMKMVTPWPEAEILEVGGGHAQIAIPLIKKGFDVTITGSSETCKERLDKFLAPESIKFKCCNMLALPFEDKSFDIVIAIRLLPHVVQWQKLIAEMCRVSKKAVIVDYPDVRSFNFISKQLFEVKKAIEGNTRPFRCFRRNEILSEFGKNGFTFPLIYPEFFIPMAIHRAVGIISFSKTVESICRFLGLSELFGSPVILRLKRGNE